MIVCRGCHKIIMYGINGLCEECIGRPTKRARQWIKSGGLRRVVYRKINIIRSAKKAIA